MRYGARVLAVHSTRCTYVYVLSRRDFELLRRSSSMGPAVDGFSNYYVPLLYVISLLISSHAHLLNSEFLMAVRACVRPRTRTAPVPKCRCPSRKVYGPTHARPSIQPNGPVAGIDLALPDQSRRANPLARRRLLLTRGRREAAAPRARPDETDGLARADGDASRSRIASDTDPRPREPGAPAVGGGGGLAVSRRVGDMRVVPPWGRVPLPPGGRGDPPGKPTPR